LNLYLRLLTIALFFFRLLILRWCIERVIGRSRLRVQRIVRNHWCFSRGSHLRVGKIGTTRAKERSEHSPNNNTSQHTTRHRRRNNQSRIIRTIQRHSRAISRRILTKRQRARQNGIAHIRRVQAPIRPVAGVVGAAVAVVTDDGGVHAPFGCIARVFGAGVVIIAIRSRSGSEYALLQG